ncbi:hypothetical protein O6H91_19G082500 [Diphasiastrum complanatum]|uniref:Uncharacterized protein n=1 Tax=Diphasiastrum complanatum TaxID=34168 RepID=A0ACC2AX25_DIPCM|nr:hypothetical protein O6H91_19G082500 [Diphasiastrum complanatum]
MVFWGVEVRPKKSFKQSSEAFEGGKLHLSQATLGLHSKANERTVVACKVGDGSKFFLCSLIPGVMESCSLDLLFDQDVVFSVVGSASVHLAGYYLPADMPEVMGDESNEDLTFGGYDFDDEDESDEDDISNESDDSDIPMDVSINTGVIIEEIFDEVPDEKVKKLQNISVELKPLHLEQENAVEKQVHRDTTEPESADNENEESEDEDGFPLPRKRKTSPDESEKPVKKTKFAEMPSVVPDNAEKKKKKKKKKAEGKEAQKLNKKEVTKGSTQSDTVGSGENANTQKLVEGLAKEKRNVSSTVNDVSAATKTPDKPQSLKTDDQTPILLNPKSASKKGTPVVRRYPNGFEVEEISMGKPDGKQAKPGKRVSMHYTGKLKSNGKIFDSNIGKKAFEFRLGVGEVIKGWDIGVNGMRIGDRRRMTIPPQMAYGASGVPGTIPQNAWLIFDVELVNVK